MITVQDAIYRLSEQTQTRKIENNQASRQRRNQAVDLYGIEFNSQGDTNTPANFYISLSTDMTYIERYEFKINILPFKMPVAGGGSVTPSTVTVNGTRLTNTATTITPNPHTHTTQAHSHSLLAGITNYPSEFSDLRVYIEGIDLSAELATQYDGNWITGEGVWPKPGLETYDVLYAVGLLPKWKQEPILKSGYKNVQIRANGVYNVTLIVYEKLSHTNR